MTSFPNFDNKHGEDALFSPNDFLEYLRSINRGNIPEIPQSIVFVYQSSLLGAIKDRDGFLELPEVSDALGGKFLVSKDGKLGVIADFGIGSPTAASILEELVAMGAKNFFNIGTAGSLQKESKLGDIILCTGSIRDEGTSHHYIEPSKYALPSKKLTDSFEALLKKTKTDYKKGASWTIDAPYRETVAEARQYQEEGVYTVEMEASALFAVAQYRKVEIMAAFSVSDLLGELKWKPAFHDEKTAESLVKLFDLIVDLSK